MLSAAAVANRIQTSSKFRVSQSSGMGIWSHAAKQWSGPAASSAALTLHARPPMACPNGAA
eukprot:3960645-Pyramimonas_sp.AAC.1